MGKKSQKVINGNEFLGKDPLTVNQAKRFTCKKPEEVSSLVENWDGESPLAVPFIQLSPDNTRVENANLVLEGFIFEEPKLIAAAKLWEMEESFMLKINKLNLSLFKFSGSLQSAILDHSNIDFTFVKKKGEEIDPASIQEMGWQGFSLRAYLLPISGLVSKLLIVIYPHPKDVLLELFPQAKNPRFPGISFGEQDVDMGIDSTSVLDNNIGTPLLPGIIPGSPLSTITAIPTAAEIVSRLSKLMRTALNPETRSSRTALLNRYISIEEKGEENLKAGLLDLVWPEPAPVNINSGKTIIF